MTITLLLAMPAIEHALYPRGNKTSQCELTALGINTIQECSSTISKQFIKTIYLCQREPDNAILVLVQKAEQF